MSEKVITYQQFKYDEKRPFYISNVRGYITDPSSGYFSAHWHYEMEFAYSLWGSSTHYIDGKQFRNSPNGLIIVNSESIHSIIQDPVNAQLDGKAGMVLLIAREYLEKMIPEFSNLYFLQQDPLRPQIRQILEQISSYVEDHYSPAHFYGGLYLEGMIHLLFYYLMEDGVRKRNQYLTLNEQKNVERLRGILFFIREHYKERFTQEDVAGRFYFSRGYFSSFFKENTGQSFKEYIDSYRVEQAKKDLIYTDHSVLDIALEHGFADSRGFINTFKKIYNITPLQFRKKISESDWQDHL